MQNVREDDAEFLYKFMNDKNIIYEGERNETKKAVV